MRVLVTGGAGFIGSHVVDALVAGGHTVAVIDDLSAGRPEFVDPGAEFLRADVASREAFAFVRHWKPEALAHLAAKVGAPDSVADPVLDAQTNVVGGLALLEACLRSGTTRIVFSSTGRTMYGLSRRFPVPERDSPAPQSPDGCAKLALEGYLGYFARVHHVRTCSLRYADVYGARQRPHGEAGVVASFADRYLRGETPTIHGDGAQTRDYVHVVDVAAATVAALERGLEGVFNVGTGVETSTLSISERIRAAAKAVEPARHGPAREGDAARSALDASALERAIGWRPRVSLEVGVHGVVDWFRLARPAL